jgi:hypothetical protein
MRASGNTATNGHLAVPRGGPVGGGTVAATMSEAPERCSDLSAPESEVLLSGPKTDDRQALKLALKELIARQILVLTTVRKPRRFGPAKRIHVLIRGPVRDADVGCTLRAVLGVYETARPPGRQYARRWSFADDDVARIRSYAENAALTEAHGSPQGVWATVRQALRAEAALTDRAQAHAYAEGTVGVPVAELARSIFRQYSHEGWCSNATYGYVRAVVLPALQARGLYAPERYRRFGLFDATRWLLTSEGTAAKTDLHARLAISRPARRRLTRRRLTGELRALARALGTSDAIDAAFAAIDAGVDSGWNDVYGD